MPAVTKQSPVVKTRPLAVSIVDRIVPVSTIEKRIKLLVYGRGKTGKTRLFSTFPTPSLLIGTEDGTGSIADVEDVDFVRITSSEEFGELTEMLKSGKYRTVGLDTGGGLQDIIVKEVLDLEDVPVQKTYGMGSSKFKDGRQMWGVVGMQFKERVNKFLRLAENGIMDVVVIAHERNFNDDDVKNDLMTPTVGAALTPSVTGWLNGACDYICQTFIREEIATSKLKIGAKETETKRKTGKVQYCLRIGPHPIFLTGFRVRRKVGDLPDSIVDPDYDKIVAVINGE